MHPIRLNTQFGVDQFAILQQQANLYALMGKSDDFKSRCLDDLHIQEVYLGHFLDDEELSSQFKMNEEDDQGFKIFNEQSDVCSCLRYFSGKWV